MAAAVGSAKTCSRLQWKSWSRLNVWKNAARFYIVVASHKLVIRGACHLVWINNTEWRFLCSALSFTFTSLHLVQQLKKTIMNCLTSRLFTVFLICQWGQTKTQYDPPYAGTWQSITQVQIRQAVPPNGPQPGFPIITHVSVEVSLKNYCVHGSSPFHPRTPRGSGNLNCCSVRKDRQQLEPSLQWPGITAFSTLQQLN